MSPHKPNMPVDGARRRPRKRRFRRSGGVAACLLAIWLAAPAFAADCPDAFATPVAARGLDAHGGDVALADGRILRLAALAEAGAPADPARRAALEALIAGQTLALASADPAVDRYGRVTALARLPDGRLLQEAALARGLAVARPEAGYLGCMPALLAAERPARAARLGVWAVLPLPAEAPKQLAGEAGRFSVVAGRVRTVGSTRRLDYLNFGPVWRQDTTVRIDAAAREALEARHLAAASLAGRKVLVRGEVDLVDGPVIDLHWAEQLEEVAEASEP